MSRLRNIFGSAPRVRVLELFLNNPIKDFSQTEIREETKIRWNDFYSYLDPLIDQEIVLSIKLHNPTSRRQVYRLNISSPLVSQLMTLVDSKK